MSTQFILRLNNIHLGLIRILTSIYVDIMKIKFTNSVFFNRLEAERKLKH